MSVCAARALFGDETKGLTVLGSCVIVFLFFAICLVAYYCQCEGGKQQSYEKIIKHQNRRDFMQSLPEDTEWLNPKVQELSENMGLPEEEAQDTSTAGSSVGTKDKDDGTVAEEETY